MRWRAIEFFAGIGGFTCACPEIDVVAAVDIDAEARRAYQLNWPHDYQLLEISSLKPGWFEEHSANLWWLSPPCQPYSRRGFQRDTADPRAAGLLHLITMLDQLPNTLQPEVIALENVVGFSQSQTRQQLRDSLARHGYHVAEKMICPTELGWPNRRPRFYLLATREASIEWRSDALLTSPTRVSWQTIVADVDIDPVRCAVDAAVVQRFQVGMDRVDLRDNNAITACFGSSYGKSVLHAGSYLVEADGRFRRFAPMEVAKLLGFPDTFKLPGDLSYRRQWKLLGNSLSIPVVRYVMSHIVAGLVRVQIV